MTKNEELGSTELRLLGKLKIYLLKLNFFDENYSRETSKLVTF